MTPEFQPADWPLLMSTLLWCAGMYILACAGKQILKWQKKRS